MKECPECGAKIREERLPRHRMRVHGKGRESGPPGARRWTPLAAAAAGMAALVIVVLLLQPAPRTQETSSTLSVPQVTSTSVGVAPGNLAPDFKVADVLGREVTRETVSPDKPGLIFFTTTYCLPCIQGLRELQRFQRNIGGDSFHVAVVFVDRRETDGDLRAYREKYGFPEAWYYALDTDLVGAKYRVRLLDTKFVLDRDGVIRFADEAPATYDTWVRALGTVGIA